MNFTHIGEIYNVDSRSNEEIIYYPVVDVISYNDAGLVESIVAYTFSDEGAMNVDFENIDHYEPDSYVYYTYDSNGNMLEKRGKWHTGHNDVNGKYFPAKNGNYFPALFGK